MTIRLLIQKMIYIVAFAIFNFVFMATAFSQDNVPNLARNVLGNGYDLTGRYAFSPEIKQQVLNLDRLIADNRVIRDPNLITADFSTVIGTNITEYTSNLTRGTGLIAGGGVNAFFSSLFFSREASTKFGSDMVTRREYEFATRSSVITRNAFFIRNQNLAAYINQSFINDVNTMTPEQIISRYGTHVMLGALLGARLDYNMSVRRTRQSGSTTINNLVTTSFNAKFMGSGAGVSHNRELENRFGEMFDISSIREDTRVVGGRPEFAQAIHNNQQYDAWIASIEGREVWSGYYPGSLVPLYDLVVEERFGARTQALKTTLRNAIHRYLEPPPPPPPVPSNMTRIEGGSFLMGSPASEAGRDSDEVQRRVTVGSFYMSRYTVTVGDFRSFVNATGYRTDAERSGGGRVWTGRQWETKADANWRNPYFSQGDNHPVVLVSWNDAVQYANWLSGREGLTPAYTINGTNVSWNRNANGYRLSTEAEWEYACRAGTTTAYNVGNSISSGLANFNRNVGRTTPVGTYSANVWGLHDMHGNVSEWCYDWYGDYNMSDLSNPTGPSTGANRVIRGGSWDSSAAYVRSANRYYYTPTARNRYLGFRLVRP